MLFIKNLEIAKSKHELLKGKELSMARELIITFSYYGIGGAQRRAISLANYFAEKGYKVYILAVLGTDSTITSEDYYGINKRLNVVLVPDYYEKHKNNKNVICYEKKSKKQIAFLKKLQILFKNNKSILSKINFHINGLRKSNKLKSFMISHPNATVINFGFNIYDMMYFSTKGLNCKIIYAETNASNKYISEQYYNAIKQVIKKADTLIFQTVEEKAEHGLEKSKKAFVIHNPVKSGLPLPYEGIRNKTIVNFCRLSRQKNLLLLIQAFEKLHIEFPDYKLEIYADTADPNNTIYKNELISYISEKKLDNSVFILPPSSDIHKIILKSSMFVSSSDYEGISNSMIEAMAIGLPCICTDCDGGGAKEMITNGENGLLVPIRDVDTLKNAMVRMITEIGLAEKCSKNASKIRETHSIEKISQKWLDVINKT